MALAGVGGAALSGAAAGSIVPGIGTLAGGIIGGASALLPEVFKFFSGKSQANKAKKINPVNPGFVANQSLIDNANLLEKRYNNYQTPGFSTAVNNLDAANAANFNRGVQGATSGGDVLELATKLNYGQGQNLNALNTQNAQGADAALGQYLQANAMAGNEAVRKNMFDLDQYNQKLQEKAALTQAGNTNMYSAIDSGADALRYFTQPQQQLTQPGANTSGFSNLGSIFGSSGSTPFNPASIIPTKQQIMQQNLGSTTGRFS